MTRPRIVLASTSRYRAELLRRIVPDFTQLAPATDERSLPDEPPRERAMRLAEAKARAVAATVDEGLVIGSDQVAALGDRVLHKPGTPDNAHEQLRASSGNCVDFYTGLCVIDSRTQQADQYLDHTRVMFRTLTNAEIDRYIAQEKPFDCAGSFKVEGAGIGLFERIENSDPTALIGLPLIALTRLLRAAGLALP